MRIEPIAPGTYVVAVSGGVDSMTLFDMLKSNPHISLVVAHFDHGIRRESYKDRELVQSVAAQYAIPFIFEEGKLGTGVSEATARSARYEFLDRVRQKYGARAIVTAHHQDDVLETAILNMLRGTAYRGISSLTSRSDIVRPFLRVPKRDIEKYAHAHKLAWHEDRTNADDRYLRNYIRHYLLSRFQEHDRQALLEIVDRIGRLRLDIDSELAELLQMQPHVTQFDRLTFAWLPYSVAKEVLAGWLRANGITNFSAQTIERLVIAAKTLPSGASVDITGSDILVISRQTLALGKRER